ncbi:TetR family transcriptional regulator [Rhodococcus hoagii]|nr:TetR family transcriptional regulator [Prescottella equi]
MTAVAPREERKPGCRGRLRIIAERGISAVSVRTVAAEAGMAVGSLRNLFSTQAELLEFSAELMSSALAARVTARSPRAPTRSRMRWPRSVTHALDAGDAPRVRDQRGPDCRDSRTPGLARGSESHAHRQLLDLFTPHRSDAPR